ncbi:MAG: lasso peptide biosynthesis B2 protein [Cyanobacteria bacterium P01_D01_bin.44]
MQRQLKPLTKLKRRWRDLPLLMITFILLSVIRLGLWLLPFRLLCKVLIPSGQSNVPPSVSRGPETTLAPSPSDALGKSPQPHSHQPNTQFRRIAKIVWAINLASRYMPGGVKCLARALTTQVLMNWHQYESEMQIGVDQTPEGGFRAHAWIEYQGHVIVGNLKDLSDFTTLLAYRGIEP